MNVRSTLILLVIVVIGVAVVFLAPSDKKTDDSPEPNKAKSEPKYVLDPKPDVKSIVKVSIEKSGKPRLAFEQLAAADEKDSGSTAQWRMNAPVESPVESYLIDSIIRTFTDLQTSRSFKPGDKEPSLADAGLSPATAVVALTDNKGKEYKFDIGKKVVASDTTYLRVNGGEQVLLVSRDLSTELKRDAKDFRGKGLTRLAGKKPVGVKLTFEGKTFDLAKGADDNWLLNAPRKAYAGNDKVNQIVNKIIGLQIKDFVEDEPKSLEAFGLDQPWLTIELTAEQKKKLPDSQPTPPTSQPAEPKFETVTETTVLKVGGFADISNAARYIQRGDGKWVASVEAKSLEGLTPKLIDVIDPKVTRVKSAQATKLELAAGEENATLVNEGGTWKGSGDLAELDVEAVRDVLTAFEDLTANDFLENATQPTALGLEKPRAVVSLTTSAAVEPIKLLIGDETKSGQHAYVQIAGQPTISVVSAAQARRLAVTPMSLRSREILTARPDQLQQVELSRADGSHYSVVRQELGWRLIAPAEAPVEVAAARDLTNDVIRLRAKRVVDKGDEAKYGLDKPEMTVRIVLTKTPLQSQPTSDASQPASAPVVAETTEHTLLVGKKGNDVFAKRGDLPYIFQLDETVYRVLTAELLNRDLFTFKPEDVTDLRVDAPGGVIEFERTGKNEWKYAPDPFVQLDPKKVSDFIAEVAKFKAERYSQYSGASAESSQLGDAPVTITIKLADGKTATLKVAQVKSGELPRRALHVELGRGFLMRQADIEKALRGVEAYQKSEADKNKPPAQPPGVPQPTPIPDEDEGR